MIHTAMKPVDAGTDLAGIAQLDMRWTKNCLSSEVACDTFFIIRTAIKLGAAGRDGSFGWQSPIRCEMDCKLSVLCRASA